MHFAPLQFLKRAPWCAFAFLTIASQCYAAVKMPSIFGDHMVLQQDGKIPIWGWADPGEPVTVALGSAKGNATAGVDGKWQVNLPALKNSAVPQTLMVTGRNTLKFEDVLVGDVWLCSGQSNMEFQMFRTHLAGEDLPKAEDPQLRFFLVPRTNRLEPQSDVPGHWEICTPKTVANFSGVAYYFARELRSALKRPIGLIGSYWGGTGAQAWTSESALQQEPPFANYVKQYEGNVKNYQQTKDDYPRLLAEYQEAKKQWDTEVKPSYQPILQAWEAAAKQAKAEGKPQPPRPQPSQAEPSSPRDPNGNPQQATVLFNGMIAPLIPYAIKGVIWYQGESNSGQAMEYRTLFPRMIADWRQRWAQGDFPFLFVQIAAYAGERPPEDYPRLREAQSLSLAMPNTGMAVTIDLGAGANIHPADKKDVGLRLALLARHQVYGENVISSGPVFDSMKVVANKIRLNFKEVGGGLCIGNSPWVVNQPSSPVSLLTGFAITGADRHWVDAQAVIEGNAVVVSSNQVPNPIAVRYAWACDPTCNLYNKEGLPASPFRTDDWPFN